MLDIDAAIKHCLDIADGQDKCAEISVSEHAKERISQCAADHRQLAEWLTELKEAKRLLKAAVEDMNKEADCGICLHDNDGECPIEVASCKFKWRYADEALAMIGEDGETDDRINPFDDYTPNNCRWVNMMVQSHNKRARMDGEQND